MWRRAATTHGSDDVARAVDLPGLRARIEELYPSMVEAGLAGLVESIPSETMLILLRAQDGIPDATGHFRALNSAAVVASREGRATHVLTAHVPPALGREIEGAPFEGVVAKVERLLTQ
jgi:hypothetical protein